MTADLHHGDAVTWLRSLPSESADLGITDPPYESLEKHRAIGTTTRLKHSAASSNDWFPIFPNDRFPELFAELYRVLRRDSHLYVFCDPETMFVAKPIAEQAGFRFWKPLIWDKVTIGMGYHYRARYEAILFFEKGRRKLADLGVADVLEAKRVRGLVCDRCVAVRPAGRRRACGVCGRELRASYPTEKPVEVSEVLVRQSSEPGELVIDPFMGSGSVGVAAVRQGRRFGGNDLSAAAVEVTRGRVEALGHRDVKPSNVIQGAACGEEARSG